MYSRDNRNSEDRYNGRPSYNQRSNRPAPLPEGFALYYIAAVCPEEINEKLEGYKQYMQAKYGSRAAQKSPAHLTIVPPFKAEEDMEKLLQDFVSAFNFSLVPFNIRLNNFGHFGNKVLFVDVEENETLHIMERDINEQFTKEFPSIIFRSKPEFHPHVTIATRDMPENKFDEIWSHFQQELIDETFACKGLQVMKLVRGIWQHL